MNGIFQVTMDGRGRVTVPSDLRSRLRWDSGARLVMVETPDAVVLMTRQQLRDRVRHDFAGLRLVDELLAERREAAAADAG